MDHSTTKHFNPLSIKENFKLKRRIRERKEPFHPSHLALAKQKFCQLFMFSFQVIDHFINRDILFLPENADPFHLMEDRIMIAIDFVPPIHIAKDQKPFQP